VLACEEGKVGGLNLPQLVDCLHWGHHGPEGKNICLNTALRRSVVLMFILSGGYHGPEGKNICLNTAPRKTVVLMSLLPGGITALRAKYLS
jgi:hypothetical protein